MFNTNQESVQYGDITVTIDSSGCETILTQEKKEIILTQNLQVSDALFL